MGELVRRSEAETRTFVEQAGFDLKGLQILQIYHGHFKDRAIFRYYCTQNEAFRVIKVRPNDEKGQREAKIVTALVDHYRNGDNVRRHKRGVRFGRVVTEQSDGNLAINMPFLGYSLGELAEHMDDEENVFLPASYSRFDGFSPTEITRLVNRARRDQEGFARRYGLVHADLVQQGCPNNITYHPGYGRLFTLDAEAFVPTDQTTMEKFQQDLAFVENWMQSSLLRQSPPAAGLPSTV